MQACSGPVAPPTPPVRVRGSCWHRCCPAISAPQSRGLPSQQCMVHAIATHAAPTAPSQGWHHTQCHHHGTQVCAASRCQHSSISPNLPPIRYAASAAAQAASAAAGNGVEAKGVTPPLAGGPHPEPWHGATQAAADRPGSQERHHAVTGRSQSPGSWQERAQRGPASWSHDVLLVDGANVAAFARATASSLHAHVQGAGIQGSVQGAGAQGSIQGAGAAAGVQGTTRGLAQGPGRGEMESEAGPVACFESWVVALQQMTSATQVYVVFDSPGSGGGPNTAPASVPQGPEPGGAQAGQDRRQLLPSYKVARTQKRHKGTTGPSAAAPSPLAHKTAATPPAPPSQTASPRTTSPSPQALRRYGVYARACERLGWQVLWSPAGREADDVLMALAHALVHGTGQPAPGGVLPPNPAQPYPNLAPNATPSPNPSAASTNHTLAMSSGLSVVVASSDSDMQQLLSVGPRVGWLELLQLPGQPLNITPDPSLTSVTADGQSDAIYDGKEISGADGHVRGHVGAAMHMGAHVASDHVTAMHMGAHVTSDHVAAMHTSVLGGSMAWLPLRMHHAWQGVGLPGGKLSAHQMADYCALLGKKEAGVRGAGVSSKAAVSLLRRFGSVEGIASAVREGRLDARLQPIAPRPSTLATDSLAPNHPVPEGLQRALSNMAITRLGCDLGPLPLGVLGRKGKGQQGARPRQQPQGRQVQQVQHEHHERQGQQGQQQYGHAAVQEGAGNEAAGQQGAGQKVAGKAPAGQHGAERQGAAQHECEACIDFTAMALHHPIYHWRVVANAPILDALWRGVGPAWAVQLVAGSGDGGAGGGGLGGAGAATGAVSGGSGSVESDGSGSGGGGVECSRNCITPKGLMLDVAVTTPITHITPVKDHRPDLDLESQSPGQPVAVTAARQPVAAVAATAAGQPVAAGAAIAAGQPAALGAATAVGQQRVGLVVLGPADFGPAAVDLVLKAATAATGAGGGSAISKEAGKGAANAVFGAGKGAAPGVVAPLSAAGAGLGTRGVPGVMVAETAAAGGSQAWPSAALQAAARVLSHHGAMSVTREPSHLPHKIKVLLRTETQLLLRGLKKAGWEVHVLPFWEVVPHSADNAAAN